MSASAIPAVRLSVVIAASNTPALLERCLASLHEQARAEAAEIIVAVNFDNGSAQMLATRFPGVIHLALPPHTTVPALRTKGLRSATGDVVAMSEDNVTFDPHWCARIKEAHALPHAAIGGSVENAPAGPMDWAVYFYEYGRYMPPNPAGPVVTLAGNNVSYKRAILDQIAEQYRDGFYETFIHQELKKQGHSLYLAPAVLVHHIKKYAFRKVINDCHHHARAFAAMRVQSQPLARRLAMAAASLLLPVLLPARIAKTILGKKRHRKELALAMPLLCLFMTSWASGEFCGYAFGSGSSSQRWR